MLTHEFGIMQEDPEPQKRYDGYMPEAFGCISVRDDLILPRCAKLKALKCFWHTLERPGSGLAYHGVTLIPPESLEGFMDILWDEPELSELMTLLAKAQQENKYVIHFGI